MTLDTTQTDSTEGSPQPSIASGEAGSSRGSPLEGERGTSLSSAREPSRPAAARSCWTCFRNGLIRLTLVLGVIGLGLAVAHRPLLTGFAYLFRVDDPAPSDALVLLLGGPDHRPAKVVELYRKKLAPVILLGESGVWPIVDLDETEQTRKYLIQQGVPAEDIRVLSGGQVTSTYDEAVRVRDELRSRPVRRITLVTTSFHTSRARWIFRKVLRGAPVEIRVAAALRPEYDESNWYRTEKGMLDYFEEVIRTLRYRLIY